MKYLFIDCSITSSGISIYDDQTKNTFLYTYSEKISEPIEFNVGKFEVKFINQPRKRKNKPWFADMFQKYMHITDTISAEILPKIDSDSQIYIEGYAYAGKGKNFNIGEFGGLLKRHIYNSMGDDFIINEIAPSQWKRFITGNGNANKQLIYDYMMKTEIREVLAELMLLGFTYKPKSWLEDIVDVYAIQKYILSKLGGS